MVTLIGEYFGAAASKPGVAAKIGQTKCDGMKWISRTSIACKVPAGIGKPLISVKVGKKRNGNLNEQCMRCGEFVSAPDIFSFDLPTVSTAIQPREGSRPTSGGFAVTLTGTGFGTFDSGQVFAVVASFYGGDALSEASTWTSDSAVVVSVPPGVGKARPISVQVGGQRSNTCQVERASACRAVSFVDYDAPVVQRVRPALSPRDGGRKVTIWGINFGSAPSSLPSTAGSISISGNSSSTSSANTITSNDTSNSTGNSSYDRRMSRNVSSRRVGTKSSETSGAGEDNMIVSNNKTHNVSSTSSKTSAETEAGGLVASGTGLMTALDNAQQKDNDVNKQGLMATIGASLCKKTEWISQTAALCVTPAGSGLFHPGIPIHMSHQCSICYILIDDD